MSRYIDADNLPRHGNRGGVVYWRDIEEQPTVDVRENVRDEWLHISDGYCDFLKCSQCGKTTDSRSNFCPNCGAQMRGEQDDER